MVPAASDVLVDKGTIAGTVRTFLGSTAGLQPVDRALVTLEYADDMKASMTTASDGQFSFRDNVPGDYALMAVKDTLGTAKGRVALGPDAGTHVDLVLRPEQPTRMFSR